MLTEPVTCEQAQMKHPDLYTSNIGCFSIYSTPSPERDTPNQDAAAIIPFGEKCVIIAVADGVGGMANGQVAATTAIQSLVHGIQACTSKLLLRETILLSIESANKTIMNMSANLATTLAVVEIRERYIRSYHIGDPLIMLVGQRGKLKFQNITHSPTGYALEAGLINEEEAIHHEERNLVSNLIGFPEMRIEIGPILKMAKHDTLLVSSDAIPDNLYIDEIANLVRKGKMENSAEDLIQQTRSRMNTPESKNPSQADDLSFILHRSFC
jgi:serine/threonine protein phosphatase PrpC